MMIDQEILEEDVTFATNELRDRRRTRRIRDIQEKMRLKQLPRGIKAIYHVSADEIPDSEPVAYIKKRRISKRGRKSAAHFAKRTANKKVRTSLTLQRGGYKKTFDYKRSVS